MSGKVAASEEDGGAGEKMMMEMDDVDRSGKYGYPKDFDPKFHGPIEKRGCTDIFFLILFIVFLVGWGFIAFVAFRQGDPQVLVNPVDSWGHKCGIDEPVTKKPFLYFFDITKCATPNVLLTGCRTTQVCVEKCPTEYFLPRAEAVRLGEDSAAVKEKMICQYSVDKSKYTVSQLLENNRCAKYILPVKSMNQTQLKKVWKWRRSPVKNVKSVLTRRCIPSTLNKNDMKAIEGEVKLGDIAKGVDKLIELLNAKQNFEYMFEDFRASWHLIAGLLAVGAIASLIWICLMRCFAGIMVWLSLLGMMIVLGFSCYYSTIKFFQLRSAEEPEPDQLYLTTNESDPDAERFITEEDIVNQFDTALKLKNTWLTFAIITGVLLVVLLLIVLFLRSRLAIAVSLIRQGARAVGDMVFTLVWPLAPWALQVLGIGFFLLVGVFLVSASEEVFKVTQNCTCGIGESARELIEGSVCFNKSFVKECGEASDCVLKNTCQFAIYQKLSNVGWLHLYNFFGVIWLLCFINDFGDMVLAGSFAGWYWTLDRKNDLDLFPVSKSLKRTLRYHLGTLAFGSLIISIIKFIRYVLEYIDYKLRQYNENPVTKAILCCCKCCFWMLEKFMKYINRNAYIMTAVYGKNFCTSARDSFFLLMRNAIRAFVLDKVTDFLLLIGKLVIVGGVAICSFFVFSKQHSILDNEVPDLHFYLMPVIVITVGTYFITSLFFSVYNMAVDTLFLCFLEDCERNDGTEEKPYYMPKELMGILGKKNKLGKREQSTEAS